MIKKANRKPVRLIATLAAVLAVLLTGCAVEGGGSASDDARLFLTDTVNGRVYTYDMEKHKAADSFLLSTGQDATDSIYFRSGRGFIAVGLSWSGNDPGVYTFDPEAAVPTASRIGSDISAQYIAFVSDTRAYVTAANWGVTSGVYRFNPSNPGAGLTAVIEKTSSDPEIATDGWYFQEICLGRDGMLYVADYNSAGGNGRVHRIDPDTDTYVGAVSVNDQRTTGLLAGGVGGQDVVFVANAGASGTDGSVDYVRCSDFTAHAAETDDGGARLALHDGTGRLYVLGSSKTHVIDTSGSPPWSASEILDGAASFGGSRMILHDGLVYITSAGWSAPYESKLYVIDAATGTHTGYSPVSVMNPNEDGASGLAVYEP